MKREENIKVGERVGLSRDEKSPTYRTLLEDVTDEGYYVVSVPLHRGIPVIFRGEQEIEFYYYRDNGQFGINVAVRDFIIRGAVRYLVLEQISDPWKLQRREFYRLSIFLPAEVQPEIVAEVQPGALGEDNIGSQDWLSVATNNLSEKGASLKAPKKLAVGERLKIRFSLSKRFDEFSGAIEVFCVVRQAELVEATDTAYRLGVEFIDCPKETRRKIAKFILKQQQHMRLLGADDKK